MIEKPSNLKTKITKDTKNKPNALKVINVKKEDVDSYTLKTRIIRIMKVFTR